MTKPTGKPRGRPKGSFKKPDVAAILEMLPLGVRSYLKEAAEGDLYPAREHKVVDRACAVIGKKTGIIVNGDAKLLLYAAHRELIAWTIYDCGLNGLYGLPSTRVASMASGKRRAIIFKYLRFCFEKSTGKTAPASSDNNGCLFSKFAHAALTIISPPEFAPKSKKAFAKAIENALTPLKKRLNRIAPRATLNVTFPKPY
jgi:hypothetical protein